MRMPTDYYEIRPEYHEGLLIFKIRTVPGEGEAPPDSSESLRSILEPLERAGLLRRLTPLSKREKERATPILTMGYGAAAAVAREPEATDDPNVGVYLIEVDRAADLAKVQADLAAHPAVERISRVPIRYALGAVPPQTPPLLPVLWNLEKIRWYQAVNSNPATCQTVRVGVLDTGIDPSHPDIQAPESYISNHPFIDSFSSDQDIVGHGTHVSGIICANRRWESPVRGICDCQLLIWKIFGDRPELIQSGHSAYFGYIVEPAMYRRALAECMGCDVVNLSIGGPGKPDFQEEKLFEDLIASGTVVIAAMGNSGHVGSPAEYPAAIPGVIAVGATGIGDEIAGFSSRGQHIWISAPGKAIWSTLPTYPGQTAFFATRSPTGWTPSVALKREIMFDAWDGTSMAAPHVAGATALLIAARGKIKPCDAKEALRKSSDQVSGMKGNDFTPEYGYGRLNVQRLLRI